MKALAVLLLSSTVWLTGCSLPGQIRTVRRAVDAGQIEGLNAWNRFELNLCFATGHCQGRYHEVASLDTPVVGGPHDGKTATFLLGQPQKNAPWVVIAAMVQADDGSWENLPVKSLESVVPRIENGWHPEDLDPGPVAAAPPPTP